MISVGEQYRRLGRTSSYRCTESQAAPGGKRWTAALGPAGPARRVALVLAVVCVTFAALSVFGGAVGTATAQDVNGCTTIDSSGSYTLTGDITDTGESTCIKINASDVVFDGQGNRIDSDGSTGVTYGIDISADSTTLSNVTVRNVTVTDWNGAGINLARAESSRITNVNATSNQQGISLENAFSVNTVVDNSTLQGNDRGVDTFSLDTNTIRDNEFRSNRIGIATDGSDRDLTIQSNTFDPDGGPGISLEGQGHVVSDNTIQSPSNAGISFTKDNPLGQDDVLLRNNTVRDSAGDGILLEGQGGELVKDVAVRNNTLTGSAGNETLVRNASGVTLAQNTVSGTGGDGIVVVNASAATLRDNDIDKDADVVGTQVLNSTDVLVEDDSLNDHGGGEFANLYVNDTDNVTIRNVTVTDDEFTTRTGRGVAVDHSTDVTVEASQITLDESGDSIEIQNSDSVSVLNNDIDEGGIQVRESANGIVRGNTVFGNRSTEGFGGIWGVLASESENITVDDNRLDNHQLGVLVGFGANDITVSNNRITDALDSGVSVARGAPNTNINDNTVRVADGTHVFETYNTSEVTVRNLEAGNLTGDTTTLDFTAENVTVRTAASRPAPPSGENDVGIYINATNTGSPNFPDGTDKSYLDLTIEYDDADVQNVDESSLSLWRNNDSGWTDVGGTVDSGANTISKNITSYSVLAPLASSTSDGGDDGTPEITDYDVTADGDEVTVRFDSDENLVDIEVAVSGSEDATLTEDDFSGDRFEGYEATYRAGEDGTYTLELVTAADAGNNDGAEDETFSETVSVDTADNETADNETATTTPTDDSDADTPVDETATPTDAGEPADETATPTDADEPADETAADADDETATTTQEDGPGFGPVLAVVALLAGAVLLVRRQ